MNLYQSLSDLVLAIHFCFVAFIILGFVVIWVGSACRWSFVRSPAFRAAHLLAMGIVMVETCAGLTCPLTAWEDRLRLLAGQGNPIEQSFMQRWVGSLLFYDASERLFALIYAGFSILIVLTFWLVPPRRARK